MGWLNEQRYVRYTSTNSCHSSDGYGNNKRCNGDSDNMDLQDFKNMVEEKPHLEMEEVNDGVVVLNKQFDTETHFTKEAINKHDYRTLITHTNYGKNVQQMTRVTGYYSKTHAWNKGKMGELKERHRVSL